MPEYQPDSSQYDYDAGAVYPPALHSYARGNDVLNRL